MYSYHRYIFDKGIYDLVTTANEGSLINDNRKV